MSRRVGQDAIVVALGGALDVSAADQLLDELRYVWDTQGLPIILNLAEVTFLDSTGVRALVLARRDLAAAGRPLTIAAASPKVRRLLELTGTDDLFRSPAPPTPTATHRQPHSRTGSEGRG
jgi:anti-sigma B factor antagonist